MSSFTMPINAVITRPAFGPVINEGNTPGTICQEKP